MKPHPLYRLLALMLLIFPVLQTAGLEPAPSAREEAMGTSHPALADDFASAFTNPAGFATLDTVYRFSSLDISVTGTFWDLFNMFSGSGYEDILPLEKGIYLGAGIMGPVDAGYAGNGKAFRLQSYMTLDAVYPNAAVASEFTIAVGARASGGWAHRFQLNPNTSLDFGLMAKGFVEQRNLGEADAVEFLALLGNPEYFQDLPFQTVSGLGLDTGLMFNFGRHWSAALSIQDLLTLNFVNYWDMRKLHDAGDKATETYTELTLPDISIGGAWHPGFTDSINWFQFEGLYLSFRDLLGGLDPYPRSYLLNVVAGLEFSFWNHLYLRGGFYEGLFSAGLGLKFGGFSMDFTYSGEELSNQPGVFSVVEFRLAFALESYKER